MYKYFKRKIMRYINRRAFNKDAQRWADEQGKLLCEHIDRQILDEFINDVMLKQ